MEELKAMFRVCVANKKDGTRCNSPALKGGNFCFQHIGGSLREHTRARSIYNGPKLDFLYPGTRQAIQNNLFVVAQAMNDGKLELATANAYNRIFSACERNLRRFEMLCQKPGPEPELPEVPDETFENETRDSGDDPLKGSLSGEQNPSVSSVSSVVQTESSDEPDIQTCDQGSRIPEPLLPRREATEAEEPALSPSRDNADDREQNPSVSSVVNTSPHEHSLNPGPGGEQNHTDRDPNAGAPSPALSLPNGLGETAIQHASAHASFFRVRGALTGRILELRDLGRSHPAAQPPQPDSP